MLVYHPELGKQRQEVQEFKISPSNVSCLRPAWALRDFVSKNKTKIRGNQQFSISSFLKSSFETHFELILCDVGKCIVQIHPLNILLILNCSSTVGRLFFSPLSSVVNENGLIGSYT